MCRAQRVSVPSYCPFWLSLPVLLLRAPFVNIPPIPLLALDLFVSQFDFRPFFGSLIRLTGGPRQVSYKEPQSQRVKAALGLPGFGRWKADSPADLSSGGRVTRHRKDT